MSRRAQTGLTLLEMIVVLMISGMALALGFQSLGQWQRAQSSISAVGSNVRETVLSRGWLYDSLRGLTPVVEAPFIGDASTLSGITLTPVTAGQGGAANVTWRIESDDRQTWLNLEENGNTMRLRLDGTSTARFSYLDDDGKLHPQWPPALGTSSQLPAAIVLTLEQSAPSPPRVWVAAIAGIRDPIQVFYDIELF